MSVTGIELKRFFLFFGLGIFLTISAPGRAQEKTQPSPPPAAPVAGEKKPLTGDEIMQKVRDNQYSDTMETTIVMTLTDKNGISQTRRFRLQRRKEDVLIRFLEPADIKDTGYLILQDEKGKSLIYVYFPPPTDDYRQINVDEESGSSNQSFLGSDFDVTDFQIRDPEDATNTYLRSETVAGIECHVVESVSKDPNYKYSKAISWVRPDYWLPIRIQFFDRQGQMVKDMKVRKFKSVSGKQVASKSEMANLLNEHKTILELETVQFDVSFPDDNFTIRRLTKP